EFYQRLDAFNRTIPFGGFAFVDGTLKSDRLIFQGGIDPIIRGMMSQPLKRPQSCGGGPFSYYAASLISLTCDRQSIHLCCEKHDICYDQLQLNQTFCDDIFCSCLNSINSSIYCENVAQPGLCLATRT
uniref:Phospholipase A(2) n=1 Tax=Meloidogyne incognita TaxID=6306 RepID=A0A914NZ31_MELIC